MTKCIVKRTELSGFISGFGPGVDDLRLNVSNDQLVGGVALSTHFLTKRITVEQQESGGLVVADVSKLLAFLRACSDDNVSIQQEVTDKKTSNFKITCGNSSVSLPPTSEVKSSASLEMASVLVNKAGEDNWESFGENKLTCYGVIDVADLSSVASLGKVVGVDKPYKFSFVPNASEGTIHTGTGVSGQMFHKFHIADAKETNSEVVHTQFGPWFPEVLACLPSGKCEIYTGASAVLVFNHQDKDCLLVVIDQDAGE